jgi:membrane protease YdiL (CAAX protease family)
MDRLIGSLSILHEEILNRGYIMTMLVRRYSVGAALLISSFLFMLIHIPTRGLSYLAITWFGMGLVYGYLYLKSGSLWVAYAFHAVHNFAADLLMYTNNEIGLFQFDPALGAAEHLPFRFILALAAIGLVYLWYGRGTPFLAPAPELARSWTDLKE